MSAVDFMNDSDKRFRQKLLINMVDLSKEMSEHPVRVMDIGYMVAEAEDNLEIKKHNFEKVRQILSRQVREKFILQKTKLTESQIGERIVVQPDYDKAHIQFLEAKKLLSQVKSKYKAMSEKGEMLRSIGQLRKKEITAGMNSAIKQGEENE